MSLTTFYEHCPYDISCYCVYSAIDCAQHMHKDFYEFTFVTNGSFLNLNQYGEMICKTNLLLFFQPGESHSLKVHDPNGAHYSFIIKKDFFEDYFKDYCSKHGIVQQLSDIPTFFTKKLPGFQMTYLSHIANTIAYVTTSDLFSVTTHFLDTLLFVLLSDVHSGEILGTQSYAVDLRNRFDNYNSLDLDLPELYSSYPISSYTISNYFKKLTGHSVVEYRNIKRMEYAAHLLTNENLPVSAIANLMNISNLSYFAKQFKKQFGITPKQYQLLYRKKNKTP